MYYVIVKINQRAIATELNISTATVSKSLRNSPQIRPETRAQVIELAARMGYRPSSVRHDKFTPVKAGKKPTSIGLLIQTDETVGSPAIPHANMVLAGVSEAGAAADISITVHHVPLHDRERFAEKAFQPAAMRRGELSGVVLTHYFPTDVVAALSAGMPCVSITNHYPGVRIDCVDVDHSSAMSLACDHLYGLGHRRIGFLAGPNDRSWVQARFAGYVQALARLGLPYDPSIADIQFAATVEDESVVRRVIEMTRAGVTAWVTPSDAIAFLWRRRFQAAGLRVPEDVSLTGVDAVPSHDGEGPLTTIRVPFQEMGLAAVRRLLDRIREPAGPVRRILMDCQLVIGQTTGPVRS